MDLSRIPILGLQKREEQEQWFYHPEFTARVQPVKAELKVFLRRRGDQHNWVIVDVDPQGAPYIVMTVQEPNGLYRAFDDRTLTNLRKAFQRGPDAKKTLAEIVDKELAKQKASEKADEQVAAGVADDMRYAGHVITPTVAARERTDIPEQVKRERTESRHSDPAGS